MTMKKFSLSLLALAVGFVAGAQTFSGGDGSEGSPYLIKTVADMNELSSVVLGGNNLAGKYVQLENDITYSSTDKAAQIGNNLKKFNGTFDGKNHTVSGFTLTGTNYQDIFGFADKLAVIKNLKVANASITSSSSYSGVIAGANNGVIENCQVVDATMSSTGGSFKGGVAGQSAGTVKNCSFSGTITTSQSAAGCIVGQNTGKIYSCYSSGTIVSNSTSSTSTHLGGIAAISIGLSSEPEITDCYFIGTINGGSQNCCGGIVGTANKTAIADCFSAAYISGVDGSSYTGGIVGTIDSGSIKNCYSASTVYNEDSPNVGGVIGYLGSRDVVTVENVLVYGAIFSGVLSRHEGCELVGTQVGQLSMKNCFFDLQMCGNYSVGGAMNTKAMTDGTAFEGFDTEVWTFTKGMYPRLKKFADLEVAKLYAVPIYLADGDASSRVKKNFTLGEYADVEWQLSDSELVKVNGNNVSVTRGSKVEDVVITAYLGESTKRSLVKIYPVIFSGEGTEANPYLISSRADMDKLSEAASAQNLSFEREYFKMTGDIDMGGTAFSPIAPASGLNAFAGIFDGAGYSLKNFALDNATDKKLNSALFGKVSKDGVVKNLTIAATDGFKVYRNFAPFVCYLYGTVENCVNYASFTASDGFSAGLVYIIQETGVVRNCLNLGNVTTKAIGAIGGVANSNYGLIEGTMNAGAITVDGTANNKIGGLVASNNGVMKNVMNAGVVNSATGVKGVGGIAGETKDGSTIENALSVAPVIPNGNYDNVGAVVGSVVAGSEIKDAFYDSQIALYPSLGVKGVATSKLIDTNETLFADASAWTRVSGEYPVLNTFASNEAVKFFATPVVISDGSTRDQLVEGFALPAGITWNTKTASVFTVANGKLNVSESDDFAEDVLVGTKDAFTRTIPVATFGKFLAGDGTETNPYQIATAADLVKLSNLTAKSGSNFEGKAFRVMNDIDMAGVDINPISGSESAGFSGKFDGNGKTLSNLVMNKVLMDVPYIGLFGKLNAASEVSNLTIGMGSSIYGVGYVGAFAGATAGKIVNCTNYASVNATASNLGGIVGYADGGAVIEKCANYSLVKSTKDYVGGIVGKAGNNVTVVKILDCVNEGAVYGTTRVGGIAGHAELVEMQLLSNKGEVKGTSANVGGLVGYTNGSADIKTSANEGEVTGASEVGGLVGYAYKKSATALLSLTSSYNAGAVTGSKTNVGGLVGKTDVCEIAQCFNMGDVANTSTKVSTSAAGAGGLVGYGVPTIKQSYNVGTVTAESSVGGIMAYPSSTYTAFEFSEVYSAGKVVATNASAKNIGTILGKASSKAKYTNVYYDNAVNSTVKAIAGSDGTVKALGTKETTELTLSDAWLKSSNHYPRLAAIGEKPASYLSTAAVVLADGDAYNSVSKSFYVGCDQVTWDGGDVFTIADGKVDFTAPSAGEYVLTASAGGLKKTVTLTLAATSGINGVDVDASEIAVVVSDGVLFNAEADYAVYLISGAMVAAGKAYAGDVVSLPQGIYLVKVANKALKVMIK